MKQIFTTLSLYFVLAAQAQTPTLSPVISALSSPVTFAIAPDDGRFFIVHRSGLVRAFTSAGTLIGTFYDLTSSVTTAAYRGVLGIAFDPDYANNKFVYIFYENASPANHRIVRVTDVANVGTSPQIIFDESVSTSNGYNVGGAIHFMPDDTSHLFIALGFGNIAGAGQTLNSPHGKYLRIYRNGTIPLDNPYYDDGNPAAGNDDRIWAYGFRNPFDFSFNPQNDSLYSVDLGATTWDEVNIVSRGLNYGWDICEGICGTAGMTNPIFEYSGNSALTGILFYHHTLLPQFDNHALVGNYNTGQILDLALGNAPAYDTVLSQTVASSVTSITAIAQGNEGCIYMLKGGNTSSGTLYRFCIPLTGIENQQVDFASEVEIFPNPASNEFSISGISAEEFSIHLFSMEGKNLGEVFSGENLSGEKITVALNHLSGGIYFV